MVIYKYMVKTRRDTEPFSHRKFNISSFIILNISIQANLYIADTYDSASVSYEKVPPCDMCTMYRFDCKSFEMLIPYGYSIILTLSLNVFGVQYRSSEMVKSNLALQAKCNTPK